MVLVILAALASSPVTLWTAIGNGGVYACVTPGDVNSDGIPDIVAGLYYSDDEPTLQAVSGIDGSIIWTSDTCKGIYQDEGLAATGDLDGDGVNDVLLATPGGTDPPGRCLIAVSGASGDIIWQWSCFLHGPNHGWGYGACSLADITGDGVPEAVGAFGGNSSNRNGTVVCIDGALGDSLWTAGGFQDSAEDVNPYPDVDGDGKDEVIVGVGGNSIAANQVWLLSGGDGSAIWSADVDGDAMCVSTVDRPDTFPGILACTFNGRIACLDQAGSMLWSSAQGGMLIDIEGGPDLDGDGFGEVALASDDLGVRCLDGSDGSVLWTYPSGSNTWSATWADSIHMGDMYVACIAAGSVNGRRAVLVDASTGQEIWQQPFGERVYGVSVVPSLDSRLSQTVMVCLQDQTATPMHLIALATPDIGAAPDGPATEGLRIVCNPCFGAVAYSLPPGTWTCRLRDLSGRTAATFRSDGDAGVFGLDGLPPGVYLFEAEAPGVLFAEKIVMVER